MPISRRRTLHLLAATLAALGNTSFGGIAHAQAIDALRRRINEGTVTIISGGVNGTYIRIAADLAAVLDRGDALRVLPILGKGSVQNITDILYLRGIDVGIVQSDVLSFIRDQGLHPNIERRIRYITKLYNEEVHVLAGAGVSRLSDLAGRKVNFDVSGSGTFITASTLFKILGIAVEPTTFDQALAVEKLKGGEIAAMIYVAGKPTELFRRIPADSGMRFVPIAATPDLLKTYLPSSLEPSDYPQLIPGSDPVETIAVGAVMAVYNWESNNERYRRVATFVDAFFNNFDQFLKAPRHPKWQEVNLAATIPGWERFAPAEQWLTRRTQIATSATPPQDPAMRKSFDTFLQFMQQQGQTPPARPLNEREREALFARFLEWQRTQAR